MNFDFKKALQKEVNVGLKEQKLRYGGGAAALVLSIFTGNIFLLLIGIVLAATGFMRWCPAYSGLGKSTVDPNEPAPTTEGGHGGH